MPRFNSKGNEKGERAGVERRGEGKEKVGRMTEEWGRKEGMGNSDGGGIAPLLLGGDRRHWPLTHTPCSERKDLTFLSYVFIMH